ncbi:hypothetical protein PAXRUDRAFT_823382 [Paxillus rubicundulus Ve08.2h10]|uniref:Uncharacterized protein n=1 Tax=Paxillus rubicundulus Ve08.2h10 TaxID=930991 RepID=A0A0D0E8X0_9AGAM|nr:hypothetical protein PAXRUDRAFT_823382 [Paxillus rubicundulus Ve08.2h10]
MIVTYPGEHDVESCPVLDSGNRSLTRIARSFPSRHHPGLATAIRVCLTHCKYFEGRLWTKMGFCGCGDTNRLLLSPAAGPCETFLTKTGGLAVQSHYEYVLHALTH